MSNETLHPNAVVDLAAPTPDDPRSTLVFLDYRDPSDADIDLEDAFWNLGGRPLASGAWLIPGARPNLVAWLAFVCEDSPGVMSLDSRFNRIVVALVSDHWTLGPEERLLKGTMSESISRP